MKCKYYVHVDPILGYFLVKEDLIWDVPLKRLKKGPNGVHSVSAMKYHYFILFLASNWLLTII